METKINEAILKIKLPYPRPTEVVTPDLRMGGDVWDRGREAWKIVVLSR